MSHNSQNHVPDDLAQVNAFCSVSVILPVAGRPQIWPAASPRYRNNGAPRAEIWDTLTRSLKWSRSHDPVLPLDQGEADRVLAREDTKLNASTTGPKVTAGFSGESHQ
jgi:hypothetical protein